MATARPIEIAGDEGRRLLSKGLDALPSEQRTIVASYYFEGLTFGEISKTLDLSEADVYRRHTLALRQLASFARLEVDDALDPARREALKIRIRVLEAELARPPADVESALTSNESLRRTEIEGQLPTLRAELERTTEPIVREALQSKLAALESELAELPEAVAAPEPEIELVPISEAERPKFDLEVQRLRLMVSRGEKGTAEAGLKALKAQYGSQGELLELEGDLATARKRWKEAEKLYERAKYRLPGNVVVEKKHADSVFLASGSGSLEDQLRASESGTPILDAEVAARGGPATLLSFFVPGLGHFLLGQQVKGAIFFGVWVLAMTVVALNGRMFSGLFRAIGVGGGSGPDPSGLFIVALMLAVLTMLMSVFDCAAIAKRAPKPSAERPKPPVDLPFE